jgi:hypothetical protein
MGPCRCSLMIMLMQCAWVPYTVGYSLCCSIAIVLHCHLFTRLPRLCLLSLLQWRKKQLESGVWGTNVPKGWHTIVVPLVEIACIFQLPSVSRDGKSSQQLLVSRYLIASASRSWPIPCRVWQCRCKNHHPLQHVDETHHLAPILAFMTMRKRRVLNNLRTAQEAHHGVRCSVHGTQACMIHEQLSAFMIARGSVAGRTVQLDCQGGHATV